ncbi:MAG: site-specific integrase [Bacteroidaceae bacterium]|nr:site-specific integrase [Bacteroidaceae bacterium]
MEGKFFLRTDNKPNEFGEQMINIQYCTQGVPCKKKTGISVKPEYWLGDNGTNKYIKEGPNGHPKAKMLNQLLTNIKKGYDEIIDSLILKNNQVIPVPVLRSILNGTYSEKKEMERGKIDFVQFVLDTNEELYKMGKVGYSIWVNVQCYMKRFKDFLQKTKHIHTSSNNILYCNDVTVDLIKDYILWRKENGNSNDTINKSLTPIFKTLKKCYRNDWIDRVTYEEIIDCYLPTNGSVLGEDKKVDYLTIEQLRELKKVGEKAKYDRTKDFIDMFLFSVFCGGMRVSDIISLRWDEVDLENRMVKHYQVKNHNRKSVLLTIPLADGGVEILERWKGRNENFVFGLLDDEFDLSDEKLFMKVKNSKVRTIDQSLSCLGEKIGLPFRLHFHCARHSFSTNGLNNGGDIKTISTLMGHSSVLTTEKVYASVLPETLHKTVEKSLNFEI